MDGDRDQDKDKDGDGDGTPNRLAFGEAATAPASPIPELGAASLDKPAVVGETAAAAEAAQGSPVALREGSSSPTHEVGWDGVGRGGQGWAEAGVWVVWVDGVDGAAGYSSWAGVG